MTHIVSPTIYPSKKSFKEAVAKAPDLVHVYDPSIFNPLSGYVNDVAKAKGLFTVTNHPKRTWFAEVRYTDGKLKVS